MAYASLFCNALRFGPLSVKPAKSAPLPRNEAAKALSPFTAHPKRLPVKAGAQISIRMGRIMGLRLVFR